MQVQVNTNPRFKVVLVGEAGVGKTSIMHRKTQRPFLYEVPPTIGNDRALVSVTVDKTRVDLCLCDTAGQERYRSLTVSYLRGAAVALIVGSVTDYLSIQAMTKDWKELVTKQCGSSTKVIGVINKVDLRASNRLDGSGCFCDDAELADAFDSVFEVSAQTGVGIDELFIEVGKAAIAAAGGDVRSTLVESPPESGDERSGCC
jgi:small GTP-binding protein